MMKALSQRYSINLLFLIGLLILISSDFIAYQQIQRSVIINEWVVHTHKVIAATEGTLFTLKEMAADVDHAILFNQPLTQEVMQPVFARAKQQLSLLQSLTQDNPIQQTKTFHLIELVQKRIAILNQIIQLYSADNRQMAIGIVGGAELQGLRSEMTKELDAMVSNEQKLLQERNSFYQSNIKKSNKVFLLTMIFSILLFVLSSIFTNFYLNQRDEAERIKSENEARLRLIIDGTHDYAIVMLDLTGKIHTWNTGAEKIYGYAAEEVIGKDFSLFHVDTNDSKYHPKNELEIAQKTGRFEEECWHKRKYGTHFYANLVITALYDTNNNVVGFVEFSRDLSERIKIAKIKKEFVSVVSHELRTPITSIRGALGLVLSGSMGTFNDKAKKLLDIANQNCERLLLLINDILDIEKIEEGKMKFKFKFVDIKDIVEQALMANKMYAEKYGVSLSLSKSINDVIVNVDPDRLIQVLSNLLSNAIKFSAKDSVVDVQITQVDNFIRVAVMNKGQGIPLEFQSQIFQKFSQADTSNTREKGGTGLGLSISKAIIEKMNGILNFRSSLNGETVFYFDLPKRVSLSNVKKVAKPIEVPRDIHNKILICEDDEDQANYLKALLDAAGFDSDIAATAAETKKLLSTNTYKALLLDLILPDQDGISLIRELRAVEKTRSLPIIVQSVISETGRNLLNGEAFSVHDWLDKPINFSRLIQSISLLKLQTYPNKPQILHIEDDINTQRIIAALLDQQVEISVATSLEETKRALTQQTYDLVILDLLLPDGNGAELLPLLSKYRIPIIVNSSIQLDMDYAKFVTQILMKSNTSTEELVASIKKYIQTTE